MLVLLGVLVASLVWGGVVAWLLHRHAVHVQAALNLSAGSSHAQLAQRLHVDRSVPRGPHR